MVLQDISHETVHQSIVEGGIVCDLTVAEWMASSSSLFYWDRLEWWKWLAFPYGIPILTSWLEFQPEMSLSEAISISHNSTPTQLKNVHCFKFFVLEKVWDFFAQIQSKLWTFYKKWKSGRVKKLESERVFKWKDGKVFLERKSCNKW